MLISVQSKYYEGFTNHVESNIFNSDLGHFHVFLYQIH